MHAIRPVDSGGAYRLPAVLVGELALAPRGWLLVGVMGVVPFGLPYYLFTLGLARIRAYRAALITLIEPVLVPIWTYLAVREPVSVETLTGGAAILLALAHHHVPLSTTDGLEEGDVASLPRHAS